MCYVYHGRNAIANEPDDGKNGKDDPRPEFRQLGCILLLHFHQMLQKHELCWKLDVSCLHNKELKEAEAAVVGDGVEPGVGHRDVSDLRIKLCLGWCWVIFTLGISALIPLIIVLTASKVTSVIPILGTLGFLVDLDLDIWR